MEFLATLGSVINKTMLAPQNIIGTVGNLVFPDAYYIGDVSIDTFKDEDHNYKAKVTKYPTETGATLADHVTIDPAVITISGEVSDLTSVSIRDAGVLRNPGALLNSAISSVMGASSMKRSGIVWEQLRAVQTNRELLTVQTNLQIYNNMIITSLRAKQDTNTAGTLRFKAVLEEVLTIDFGQREDALTLEVPEDKAVTTTAKNNKATSSRAKSSTTKKMGLQKPTNVDTSKAIKTKDTSLLYTWIG